MAITSVAPIRAPMLATVLVVDFIVVFSSVVTVVVRRLQIPPARL